MQCLRVFPNQTALRIHLKNTHNIVNHSALSLGYFHMIGGPLFVPPDRTGDHLALRWCPLHALPLGACPVCVEIDALKGPKPPFRVHQAVSINFKLKRDKFKNQTHYMTDPLRQEHGTVTLHADEPALGVVISQHKKTPGQGQGPKDGLASSSGSLVGSHESSTSHSHGHGHGSSHSPASLHSKRTHHFGHAHAHAHTSSSSIEWRGRPIGMLTDRFEVGWMCVEVLLTHQEALKRKLFVPKGLHANQLLRPMAPHVSVDYHGNVRHDILEVLTADAAEDMGRYIRWVPMHTVDRTFPLYFKDQKEIDHIVDNPTHETRRSNAMYIASLQYAAREL
ncbi:hypothetical protein B484DRAFT_402598 [Ochromonadaceae sp. CCMP2298]|nr:hypothetical protein B484DRAFT_402598 [Ochromonadaceae sp. CCMP2298]